MIESVDSQKHKTIYWFGGTPRVGLIVEQAQNCVTDAIASGYEFAHAAFGDAVEKLEGKGEALPQAAAEAAKEK